MTRAERIAELRAKLALEHAESLNAPDLATRNTYAAIANETAREIVMLLAAIHSPRKGA